MISCTSEEDIRIAGETKAIAVGQLCKGENNIVSCCRELCVFNCWRRLDKQVACKLLCIKIAKGVVIYNDNEVNPTPY